MIELLIKGVFTLPDSDSYTDSYEMYKGYTGTNSDDSYDKLLLTFVKSYLVSTNIGAKLGAVGIKIGIGIGIGPSPVETVLHTIMLSISIGISVEQCKHTITDR